MLVPECFLDRIELAVARQAFHGHDVRAVGLHGEHGAALDGLAVQLHGARAAERGFAAHVRTRQARNFAQKMDKEEAWLHVLGIAFSVDCECDVHSGSPEGTI